MVRKWLKLRRTLALKSAKLPTPPSSSRAHWDPCCGGNLCILPNGIALSILSVMLSPFDDVGVQCADDLAFQSLVVSGREAGSNSDLLAAQGPTPPPTHSLAFTKNHKSDMWLEFFWAWLWAESLKSLQHKVLRCWVSQRMEVVELESLHSRTKPAVKNINLATASSTPCSGCLLFADICKRNKQFVPLGLQMALHPVDAHMAVFVLRHGAFTWLMGHRGTRLSNIKSPLGGDMQFAMHGLHGTPNVRVTGTMIMSNAMQIMPVMLSGRTQKQETPFAST